MTVPSTDLQIGSYSPIADDCVTLPKQLLFNSKLLEHVQSSKLETLGDNSSLGILVAFPATSAAYNIGNSKTSQTTLNEQSSLKSSYRNVIISIEYLHDF